MPAEVVRTAQVSQLCAWLQPQPKQDPEIKLSSASFPKGADFKRLCNKGLNAYKGENYCILKHRWCVFSSWNSFHMPLPAETWEMLKLFLSSPKKSGYLQAIVCGSLLFGLLKLCCHLKNSKVLKWSSKCNCRKGSQGKGPSLDRWYSKFFVSACRVLCLYVITM